ncbi:MAG: hypothetical protein EOM83_09845 [Clostridia bacterium]|nr:hypothetical protein [Clostridia bacterium]
MKQYSFIIIILLTSNMGSAQLVKLSKDIDIDTLRMWMNYSYQIEPELAQDIQKSVTVALGRFNSRPIGFVAVLDSTPSKFSMKMNMGEINYVDNKDDLIWTGIGLVTLAGHVYLISTIGWTLPILLLPSTVSEVSLEPSLNLVTNKPKQNRFFVNPMGYLRKKEKQKEKMVSKMEKVLYRFLKNLGKQDERNNRF